MFYRLFFGSSARRAYLALIFGVAVVSIGVRVRSYLLTRKIQEVLSGLERVRVDMTTEEELLRTVPYLIPNKNLSSVGTQLYFAEIANSDELQHIRWVLGFLSPLWPVSTETPHKTKWDWMDLPTKVAYVLGWRNLAFSAYVSVSNGTVSSSSYRIEPDVRLTYHVSYLVVARSAHGFWMSRGRPMPVHSTDDESSDYRFGRVEGEFSGPADADSTIRLLYTPTASRNLLSHVYQVNLSCYWGIIGCDSARQVTPLLWQDRQANETATAARVASMAGWTPSANPCPDRILAGRVRTLLDLDIALLEVVRSRSEMVNREGDSAEEIVTDYRLEEVIRGQPKGPWTNIRYRWTIPWPSSPRGETLNPVRFSFHKHGEKFLFFSGAKFDSCRIVPATPSALSAVRNATPEPRRQEDNLDLTFFPRM